MQYEVSGHHLTASIDQEGRRTEYSYEEKPIDVRYLEPRIDDPITVKYHLLKEIKHPTGAISLYMYDKRSRLPISEKGVTDKYVVASRADFMDQKEYDARGVRETRVNYERYTYAFKTAGKDDNYQLYVYSANLFRPNGMVETHSFNKKGRRTRESDKYRNIPKATLDFVYDKNGRLTKETKTVQGGTASLKRTSERTWDYDAWGNLTSSTDELNNTSTTEYDTRYSLPLRQRTPKDGSTNIVTVYTLNQAGTLVTETKVYEESNKLLGNPKQKTGYVYGPNSVLTDELRYYGDDLSNSYKTSYTYDDRFLFMESRTSHGAAVGGTVTAVTESYKYDAFGRVVWQKDANGNVTETEYDQLGRMTKETYPDGTFSEIDYNDDENEATQTNERGESTLYRYTPLGQISRVVDADSLTTLMAFQYDLMLRPVYELTLDEGGVKSAKRLSYDHFDRVVSTVATDSSGKVLSDETVLYQDVYDKETARAVTVVKGDDAAKNVVATEYTDLLGRTVRSGYFYDGKELIDTYTYDKAGNCLTVLTERDRSLGLPYTTKSGYDYAGQAVLQTNALEQTARSEYDALGRLTSSWDYMDNMTSYSYDSLGRLTEQQMRRTSLLARIIFRTRIYRALFLLMRMLLYSISQNCWLQMSIHMVHGLLIS